MPDPQEIYNARKHAEEQERKRQEEERKAREKAETEKHLQEEKWKSQYGN